MHKRRLHPALVLMHWVVATLVLLSLTAILVRSAMPAGDNIRPVLRQLHMALGELTLAAVVVRLAVRAWVGMPPRPATHPVLRYGSNVVHGLLYGTMLLMPLTGVLFMQAGDKVLTLFGWTLPTLVGSDPMLHAQLKELHTGIGNAVLGLIALHVSAALWHHHALHSPMLRDMSLRHVFRSRAWRRRSRHGRQQTAAALQPGHGTPSPQQRVAEALIARLRDPASPPDTAPAAAGIGTHDAAAAADHGRRADRAHTD